MLLATTGPRRAKLNVAENSRAQRLDERVRTRHGRDVRRIPALVTALLAAASLALGQTPGEPASAPVRAAPTRPAPRPAGPVVAEPPPEAPADAAASSAPATVETTPSTPTPAAPPEAKPESPPPAPVETEKPGPSPAPPATPVVPVKTWLDAQIELARRGFSSGSIDAATGPKTRAALRAFQESQLLVASGELDTATKARLAMAMPAIAPRQLTDAEIAALQPLSPTWLGKSQQTSLAYETALEAAAEKFHAHPLLLKKLNPQVDWAKVTSDTIFNAPAIDRVAIDGKAARLEIRLAECVLEAFDANGRIIAHFPVSIGRLAESRPVGELHVTVVIPDPNYTFDPAVFPESAEARELGRKLILQPGPNNPVGVAWIGLDRPGYGIHGTPSPERVGNAESHGCFRLANWDARTLLSIAWVGLPVNVVAGDAAN